MDLKTSIENHAKRDSSANLVNVTELAKCFKLKAFGCFEICADSDTHFSSHTRITFAGFKCFLDHVF